MFKFIAKLYRFHKESRKWLRAGRPLRPPEVVLQLFNEVCSKCEHYQPSDSTCGLCGCHINEDGTWLNKLAWATTKCPDDPPRWVEYKK